jgi:hypothetical protein
MWAGDDNGLLHQLSEAWPIVLALGACGQFFIGRFARSKINDKALMNLTETVESMVKTLAAVEEKQGRIQANIEHGAERMTDACRDITSLRERADRDTRNINYMLGRLDFDKIQRKDSEPSR